MHIPLLPALLLSASLGVLSAATAAAAPVMVVVLKSGLRSESDVSQVRKVTFSAGSLTVTAQDGKTTASPLSDIQRIHFATGTPVRGPLSRAAGKARLEADGRGTVRLSLAAPARLEADLFDLEGNRVRTLGALSLAAGEHTLSLDRGEAAPSLPGGLYLLQVRLAGQSPERLLLPVLP